MDKGASSTTYRTITNSDVVEIGVNFELNFSAVARTFVCLFHGVYRFRLNVAVRRNGKRGSEYILDRTFQLEPGRKRGHGRKMGSEYILDRTF